MATPVVEATTTATDFNRSGSDLTLTFPTGTTTGDIVLFYVTSDSSSPSPVTMPSGYVELYNEITSTRLTGAGFSRVIDGTEGSTVIATLSSGSPTTAKVYRISGASGTPEVTTTSLGSSTTNTPPPITPSGGSSDYLYITIDHIDTYLATITSFPSGYTNTGDEESGPSGTQCKIAWAEKSTTATTSETPGPFTLSSARHTVVSTTAVKASGGGGGGGFQVAWAINANIMVQ